MKWFYDRRISTKLYICFGMLALITAVIGWVTYNNSRKMAMLAQDLFDNQTGAIVHLSDLRSNFSDVRLARRRAVTMHDLSDRKQQIEKALSAESKVKNTLEIYLQTKLVPDETAILPVLQNSLQDYFSLAHQMDTYLLQMNDDKVLEIQNGPSMRASQNATDQIDKLIAINLTVANATVEEDHALAAVTARNIVMLVSGGLLVSILLAFCMARLMGKALKKLQAESEKLAVGDVDVHVDISWQDEIGSLGRSFQTMAETIKQRALEAQAIASGDTSAQISAHSDKDVLGKSLQVCADNVRALVEDAAILAEAGVQGKLDVRANASRHSGDFRKVVDGINAGMEAMAAPLSHAIDHLEKLSRGINGEQITRQYRGEFARLRDGFNSLFQTIRMLVDDSGLLAKAAVDGKLATRADASRHQGEFRKIVEGVNQTLDAVIGPLNVAADYVDKISKGEIPAKITDNYNGDFNVIKNNLNTCIDAVNALVSDAGMLADAAVQGKLATRADATRHQGDYRKVVEGVNHLLDATLQPIEESNRVLRQIRGGNLRERVEIECKGDHQKMKDAVNGVYDWLKGLVEYVTRMANGDMAAHMEKASDQDQIFEWLVLLKSNIVQLQSELGRLIAAAKNGDLVERGDPGQFKGAYSELMASVNDMFEVFRSTIETVGRMSEPLTQAAGELSRVAHEMGSSAEQTASQANMVSAGSEQVSRNIQTVATAADEMGASIREIAKNTADATKVATAAVRSAEDTNVTIGKLGQSSAEIGQVIKVITSIAQQTNLLALNATIEAARAGEAGKGFAVVANEVKELAKETAKATEDISRKIEAIQTDTKGAVAAIEQIGSVIGQINDIQNTVASAVEEQSVTTNEITRNLTEAAKGGSDISHSIAGVAEAARTTTGGAAQTQKSAETLERLAEDLQAVMGRFRYESGTQRVNPAFAAGARTLNHQLVGATIQ